MAGPRDPLFDLQGQAVIITGASRGIGRHLALGMAARGARVGLLSRSRDALEAVAGEIRGGGGYAVVATADLREVGTLGPAFDALVSGLGGLDVLVNNAGINIRTPSLEVTPALWREILSSNLESAFFCAQAAAKEMEEMGGAIVNIGSVAGVVAIPTGAPYAASKGGMHHLTRALALEWAPLGIRVNAVAPWYFRTPLTQALLEDPAYLARIRAVTPMDRVGELDELLGVVCFLASRASGYITGQVIPVDGGMSIQGMGLPAAS